MSAELYRALAERHRNSPLGEVFARLAAKGTPAPTPRTVITGRTVACTDLWDAARWIMLVTQAKRINARIRRWRRTGTPTDAP